MKTAENGKHEGDRRMKFGLFRHGQPTAHFVGAVKNLCGIFAANIAD
jgi:hypothetical protein